MSFNDNIKKLIHNLKTKVVTGVLGSFIANGENKEKFPVFPEWFFSARLGQPRESNLMEIRTFAKSPWVQMAINTIKKEVSQIPYEIILSDENEDNDDIKKYDKQIKNIKDFFKNINSNKETLYDLMDAVITDLGEIDAGTWIKVYSSDSYAIENVDVVDEHGRIIGTEPRVVLKPFGRRKLLEVWYADGATFLFDIDIFRRIRGYYQYSFKHPRTSPILFEKDEVIYFMLNRRSYTLYGFSPAHNRSRARTPIRW